jgi:hypothetical protein
MDMSLLALVVSMLANVVMVGLMLGSRQVSVVEVLADFKRAVVKVKAAKDKVAVDTVALEVGIPQILEILNPK